MSDNERKRLERLRANQIADRHPGDSKIRGYDWSQAAKRGAEINKKKKKKPLVVEIFKGFPGRWQGVIMAELLGIPVMIVMVALLPEYWRPLAIIPPVLTGIAGWVLGAIITDE